MMQSSFKHRARESAKLAIRRGMTKLDLDIARDPYMNRLVRTMSSRHITTVIDVGANVGQFGTQLRHAGFAGRIVSVEPLSSAFTVLSRRAGRDAAWECVRGAVGSDAAEANINVSANSYSSSLLPVTEAHLSAAPESQIVGTESVPMIKLADLVAQRGITPLETLLKVDTQGYESQVLDSAGPLLGDFGAVQLELSVVELYAGQALHEEITQRLRDAGYALWSMETGISGPDGRLLQYDGLFVRT